MEVRNTGRLLLPLKGQDFELEKCHYAPKLIGNYLSGSQLDKHGYDIMIWKTGKVEIMGDGNVLCTGQQVDGMYEMHIEDEKLTIAANHTHSEDETDDSENSCDKNSEDGLTELESEPDSSDSEDQDSEDSCDESEESDQESGDENSESEEAKPVDVEKLMRWHRTLGHVNLRDLNRLSKPLNFRKIKKKFACKTCLLAKSKRLPFRKRLKIKSVRPLQMIPSDVCGPLRIPNPGGYKYFLTFIDDYSRYTQVYLLKSKKEVFCRFQEYKAMVENKFDLRIKTFRSDNGTEYRNKQFKKALKEWGIRPKYSQVHTPQQNGVSERMNRTIKEGVWSLLIDSGLHKRYWPQAVRFAVYIRNRLPHSSIKYRTPFELWNDNESAFKHMIQFGCEAVAKKSTQDGSFDEASISCRVLGFSSQRKGYVLLDNRSGQIFESRDVQFLNTDSKANDSSDLCEEFTSEEPHTAGKRKHSSADIDEQHCE